MNVLLVGLGRWGENHLRVLSWLGVTLWVADVSPARLDVVRHACLAGGAGRGPIAVRAREGWGPRAVGDAGGGGGRLGGAVQLRPPRPAGRRSRRRSIRPPPLFHCRARRSTTSSN